MYIKKTTIIYRTCWLTHKVFKQMFLTTVLLHLNLLGYMKMYYLLKTINKMLFYFEILHFVDLFIFKLISLSRLGKFLK